MINTAPRRRGPSEERVGGKDGKRAGNGGRGRLEPKGIEGHYCERNVSINVVYVVRVSTFGSESSQQAMSASASGFMLSLPTRPRASRGEEGDKAACKKSIMHTRPWGGT